MGSYRHCSTSGFYWKKNLLNKEVSWGCSCVYNGMSEGTEGVMSEGTEGVMGYILTKVADTNFEVTAVLCGFHPILSSLFKSPNNCV